MFWNRKNSVVEEIVRELPLVVFTIPQEFYGGSNPVIKFKDVEKKIEVKKTTKPVSTQSISKTISLFENRKFLFGSAALLFIFFLGGSGFYYWKNFNNQNPTITKPVNNYVVIPTTSLNNNLATSTTSSVEVVILPDDIPTTTKNAYLELPSMFLQESADLDKDGISDDSEEVFNSDPGTTDTDEDGYPDGLEIFHLYSPNGYAPTRLSSSGLIKEFINPKFGYKIYYPANWAFGNVDTEYRDVLISTISGDNIEIRVFDRGSNQSFEDWFGENAKGEKLEDLQPFTTAFKDSGKERKDKLVYYFMDSERTYSIAYHTTESVEVKYKTVINMVARSFRFSNSQGTLSEMPAQ